MLTLVNGTGGSPQKKLKAPRKRHGNQQQPKRTTECNTNEMTGLVRFPLSNFRYFWRPFSELFSSFPHGTCSLSVSRQYLALDGAYHPFRTGIPTYSTLRIHSVRGRDTEPKTGISPSMLQYIQLNLDPGHGAGSATLDYNPNTPLGATVFNLSSSRFSRPYWGNPC